MPHHGGRLHTSPCTPRRLLSATTAPLLTTSHHRNFTAESEAIPAETRCHSFHRFPSGGGQVGRPHLHTIPGNHTSLRGLHLSLLLVLHSPLHGGHCTCTALCLHHWETPALVVSHTYTPPSHHHGSAYPPARLPLLALCTGKLPYSFTTEPLTRPYKPSSPNHSLCNSSPHLSGLFTHLTSQIHLPLHTSGRRNPLPHLEGYHTHT